MKLLDVITAAGGRVSGGDPYLWQCYGPNANFMEFRTNDGKGYSHCVYDTKTYDVYFVYVEIPETEKCWQWNNPSHFQEYLRESELRKVDPYEAWDEVKWMPIETEDGILNMLKAIGEGEEINV